MICLFLCRIGFVITGSQLKWSYGASTINLLVLFKIPCDIGDISQAIFHPHDVISPSLFF